jgi:hypothetical protein
MVASRKRPKGALAPFGLASLVLVLIPSGIGYQDIVSLLTAEAAAAQRIRQPMIASPFGTIHEATLILPRPLGTTLFEPSRIQLASLDPSVGGIIGAIGASGFTRDRGEIIFPTVDRSAKGDFLGTRMPSEPDDDEDADATRASSPADDAEIEAALRFEPFPEYDIAMSLELHPQIPTDEPIATPDNSPPDLSVLEMANDPNPANRTARLFFGGDLIGPSRAAIVPWSAGEEPILMLPRAPVDSDLKRTALAPPNQRPGGVDGTSETIAGKGEVTSDNARPKSPAERLRLIGKSRDKAEKCLANAVYFESRGEPVRGQIAVAQVVMNRVFSGYYPNDVCSVVYQNAYRHLACQFTFACDGIPDVVNDAESWDRAKRIAKATLDGRVWLPEIGKATHYHASWVRPRWVREMRRLHKLGVHTFYRPRYWGDGSDAPSWGTPTATAEAAVRM